MMDEIDQRTMDVFITKIGELFALLSEEAQGFIKYNLEEDDIRDFERLLDYYQFIIRERFYIEDEDESDYERIKSIKLLVELLRIYLD